MKILWVNSNFMHPTNKGGAIRTLEMLLHLQKRHEIHYAAIENPAQPEGPKRAHEYSYRAYAVRHKVPERGSAAFAAQLVGGMFSPLPLAMKRFRSVELGVFLARLIREEGFDRMVVDHLTPATYFPDLEHGILFQHNVETVIWRRHAEHAADPLRRLYFGVQARRMFEFERRVCRAVAHIVAVSAADAENMRKLFGVTHISEIPTGVNIEHHLPPPGVKCFADLAFVGSMDWLANIDGVKWFVEVVLPLVRRRRPEATFGVIGRMPPPEIRAMAERDPKIFVTGTVEDVRPYLWGSKISVVPLRIGGGTRLKIYESMAAKVPVISTSVGAEGLEVHPPENARIADSAEDFAEACVELLEDAGERTRMAAAAWEMVNARFSWERVAECFERVLEHTPRTLAV